MKSVEKLEKRVKELEEKVAKLEKVMAREEAKAARIREMRAVHKRKWEICVEILNQDLDSGKITEEEYHEKMDNIDDFFAGFYNIPKEPYYILNDRAERRKSRRTQGSIFKSITGKVNFKS